MYIFLKDDKRKVRKALTALIIAAAIALSGCASAPAHSPEEEVPEYVWSLLDEQGREKAEVTFEDDVFTMTDESGEVLVKGEYFIDDKCITVISKDCGVSVFEYLLERNHLIMSFGGKKAVFTKKPF